MNKLIGLVGFKRVGKSTAAKYLEEKYGFVRHNFKDALIAEAKIAYPDLLQVIADSEGYQRIQMKDGKFEHPRVVIDELFATKPPLMRAFMINFGTDDRRVFQGNDYWVEQYRDATEDLSAEGYSIVTDDVRFLNEANLIKEAKDSILIRLTRPDITTGGNHPSETEQLEIVADYTIECKQGDHEHLYRELDTILKR